MPLEDELGDILQKARDGKDWSSDDLVRATGIAAQDIQRIENYDLTPSDANVLKLAKALDLDGPALINIAQEKWLPKEPAIDPDFDLVCMNVFMGEYPVTVISYVVTQREKLLWWIREPTQKRSLARPAKWEFDLV